MSSALAILKRARAAGVVVRRDGDQLRLKAPKAPDPELIEELRAHKAELLALLSSAAPSDQPIRVEYPLNRMAGKEPASKNPKQKPVSLGHLLGRSPQGCYREVIPGHWLHFKGPPSEQEFADEREWQLRRLADLKKGRDEREH